jgi:hypothetical protein
MANQVRAEKTKSLEKAREVPRRLQQIRSIFNSQLSSSKLCEIASEACDTSEKNLEERLLLKRSKLDTLLITPDADW